MLSTVFSVSAAVRRWTSEPLSNAPAFAFGSTIVLMEVCAAFMTDWGMRAVAQANVAVMVASSSEGAMKELLNIMCDAVVQVDESLMLTTSSVRLDALLLRTPHVDAESFTSLLDDTSKGRFVEFANRNERLPQSLHVQFRGERGVFFRAQLFHVRFENVAGRVGHLIGIVEESGGTPRAMPLISASLWQTRRHSRTSATSGTDLEHDSGSDRSGLISTSSSDSNFLAIQAVDREDVVALWVDTGSSNLRIRSCTASFTSYSGAMPEGQSFLKLLRRRHRASVLQWIRDAAASTGNDDADRAAHPHRLAMRFRTTGGAVEVEAKCNVQPTRRGTACLEFSDLVICDPNGRPEPQASSRRGTSSRFIKRLRL